jgi:hypothetical protein
MRMACRRFRSRCPCWQSDKSEQAARCKRERARADGTGPQAMAALAEDKAVAARSERESSMVPLCGHVNRRRLQLVQVPSLSACSCAPPPWALRCLNDWWAGAGARGPAGRQVGESAAAWRCRGLTGGGADSGGGTRPLLRRAPDQPVGDSPSPSSCSSQFTHLTVCFLTPCPF